MHGGVTQVFLLTFINLQPIKCEYESLVLLVYNQRFKMPPIGRVGLHIAFSMEEINKDTSITIQF